MGILDDAIREHLDLKRRLGAEDEELARLEDEAFGLPSRPGDPDFPEDQPEASAETAVAEPPPPESPAQEAPPVEPAAAPPAPAEPEEGGLFDHGDEELDLDLDVDLPEAQEVAPPPPAAEQPVAEAPAQPVTEDQPAVAPEPPAAEAPPEPPIESLDTVEHEPVFEPPVESLDTVEHHFEGAIEDTGEAEAIEEEVTLTETGESELVEGSIEDTGEAEVVEGELERDEAEDEDVLEETPEFLRDQPEDDELWFEQGEPKDFDF